MILAIAFLIKTNYIMSQEIKKNIPEYIFEASWEVCNIVGGIYTVLSSRAQTMVKKHGDKVIFIGPELWKETPNKVFKEDKKLYAAWREYAEKEDKLKVRIGRWQVPGKPIAILVEFTDLYACKDEIYAHMWQRYGVDSLHAYGDYDEACMFAYMTGKVIESFYKFYKLDSVNVVAHFNEWMLGMGALYVNEHLPKVGTIFTTHATTVGRSIAANGKPLYNQLMKYNGDQMATELNVEAKHSLEKTTAHVVDCFTTVSGITARESKQLLGRNPLVTPNGFEKGFIPKGKKYEEKRAVARETLMHVAERLLGYKLKKDALLVGTSGRYEYRNKGLDVFVDVLAKLRNVKQLKREVVAFIMVPAWVKGPREDLIDQLNKKQSDVKPLIEPYITHWLHNMEEDKIINQMKYLDIHNAKDDKVKIIFVPSYLKGDDGIFNMPYYDLLIGLDLTVFPSYYEPWGYTPHESIAFSVPTITTSLAGFGLWMYREGDERGMDDGAEVIVRDDYNFVEASSDICNRIYEMTIKTKEQEDKLRKKALERANFADWEHFFKFYEEAYNMALEAAKNRN